MNAFARTREAGRHDARLQFNRRFDKIVELLVHLASIKPNRDQYQAVKLFYLADKEHFNRYGRPITFERYFALDYGPVASTALDLIKGDKYTLRAVGLERLPIVIEKRANIYTLERAEREADYNLFSKSDISVFDEVVEKYGDKSFNDLFQLTHDHYAYKAAWNSRAIGEHRAPIFYEDMLDETPLKEEIIEDLEPIAAYIR